MGRARQTTGASGRNPIAVTQLRALGPRELWLARLHYARLEREARLGLAAVWLRNRLFGVGVFLAFATFGGASPAYLVLEWPGFVAALAAGVWAVLVAWGLRKASPMHRLAERLAAEETQLRRAAAQFEAYVAEATRAWRNKTMLRQPAHEWARHAALSWSA